MENLNNWEEYEKELSNGWWNYWNYQGQPDRDLIQKWWIQRIRSLIHSAEERGYEQGKRDKAQEYSVTPTHKAILENNAENLIKFKVSKTLSQREDEILREAEKLKVDVPTRAIHMWANINKSNRRWAKRSAEVQNATIEKVIAIIKKRMI